MSDQPLLKDRDERVEEMTFEPIKGYPMLNWRGKRPFTSTQYYPAQIKERHGEPVDGWMNKIYWGDNLQVMSHLLKEYRGKVNLAYIDPPYDSKADYRKKVALKGKSALNDVGAFEEKQYTDIWTNDAYLQYFYERVVLIKQLLHSDGSVWVHCDWHKSHQIRCILDEIFGAENLQNEIIWQRTDPHNDAKSRLGWVHDTIFWYGKNRATVTYNWQDVATSLSKSALKEYSLIRLEDGSTTKYTRETDKLGRRFKLDDCTYKGSDSQRRFEWRGATPSPKRVWPYKLVEEMDDALARGEFYLRDQNKGAARCRVSYLDEREGQLLQTIWTDTGRMKGGFDYPTQKPVSLLERIIKAASHPRDLVLDCFMGSGTTQAVAMKLGRRFLGADINLGAIQTTTKRLVNVARSLKSAERPLIKEEGEPTTHYIGFEVYNVNHYDVFRNPLEARDLLLEALEINPLPQSHLFDGEKDGRMVKLMPVNRIATRADLTELISGFNYKDLQKRQNDTPTKPVEKVTLVCMGHEPDLAAQLKTEMHPFTLDVEVVDVLRDKKELTFKRNSEARIVVEDATLRIERFYPMNLLQKLSLETEKVEDWRELVESVMIDWNYDGVVLEPKTVDVPDKNDLVTGHYSVPADAGTIRVKITDVLSESLEVTVQDG